MKKIEISRYSIPITLTNISIVENYFKGNEWKKNNNKEIYCRKRTSTYFKILKSTDKIIIDVWEEGSFGIILPEQGRYIGLAGKAIYNKIIDNFIENLRFNNIEYTKETTSVYGHSQNIYIIIALIIPAIIGLIIAILIR
jgi:hypothetical protein